MTGQNPLFILFGNGSMLNRGCEAILRSTIDILQGRFGPCRFVNSSLSRIEMAKVDGLDADIMDIIPKKVNKWTSGWLRYQFNKRVTGRHNEVFAPFLAQSSACLALGGDNYSLDYGGTVRYFQANDAILRRNKPVVIWGASVGPFTKNPAFEKYAARELKRVTLILARESETVNYLASLGISDNVKLVSDPAFVLETQIPEQLPTELEIIDKPCIGINLSPLIAKYWQGSQPWIESAASCVRAVLECVDLPVVLIPHVFCQGNDDHMFMKQIADGLDAFRDRVVLAGPQYNAQQLKYIISKMKIFIGARTHSTIASLSSCVPTLSIGYSMKARGINTDIFGHNDWLVPIDELKPQLLTEKISQLLEAESHVRSHLTKMMPAYKENARAAAGYVEEILQQ